MHVVTAHVSKEGEGVEDVKPSITNTKSVDDFDVDDFGAETMEALDAVEENALKPDLKIKVNINLIL